MGLTFTTLDDRTFALAGPIRRELELIAYSIFGNAIKEWTWTGVYNSMNGPMVVSTRVKFRRPTS